MSEKLNDVMKGSLLDIYSIMENEGPYVRSCDEGFFTKFEEFEKKYNQKNILLIKDYRGISKGEHRVYAWTTYANMVKSIAKFLLLNTGFLDDCVKWASIRYDIPCIEFDFDVEYKLAFLLKNHYSNNLVTLVYGCSCLYNSQVELDSDGILNLYDFLQTYNELVYMIVDYTYTKYYETECLQ